MQLPTLTNRSRREVVVRVAQGDFNEQCILAPLDSFRMTLANPASPVQAARFAKLLLRWALIAVRLRLAV